MSKYILFPFLLLLLTACNKNLVPLTSKMEDNYKWTEEDLRRIQFYTSGDVILQRSLTNDGGGTEIISGKIKVVDGKKVEQVVIRKGTKGVAVASPKKDKISVSFEISDEHYITFLLNPARSDKFYMSAKSWNDKIGTVLYNGEEFNCTPKSADVFLMVDLRKIEDSNTKLRVAKGRDVN